MPVRLHHICTYCQMNMRNCKPPWPHPCGRQPFVTCQASRTGSKTKDAANRSTKGAADQPERRSQSRMSCDKSTSSTVQKLATAFLYSSHRSWYLQQGGQLSKRRAFAPGGGNGSIQLCRPCAALKWTPLGGYMHRAAAKLLRCAWCYTGCRLAPEGRKISMCACQAPHARLMPSCSGGWHTRDCLST